MLIKAEQKFVRQSPIKLRLVANSVRKLKSANRALFFLESMQKNAAEPIAKTIKQAMANAKNNHGLNPDTLVIRELIVNEGPNYKRGNPVSRGRFHPILKKTAHIRVIVEDVQVKNALAKPVVQKEEVKTEEKVEEVQKTAKISKKKAIKKEDK